MKQISLTDFRRNFVLKNTSEWAQEPCIEIVSGSEPIAILVIGVKEGMRARIAALCSMIDAARGTQEFPKGEPSTGHIDDGMNWMTRSQVIEDGAIKTIYEPVK